jgi:hypothetical protein
VTSNEEFKANFAKILHQAGAKAEMVLRKTALQLQTRMVQRSPVLTGRFRSNWQCGIDRVNEYTDAEPGDNAIENTGGALDAWIPGQTIYLTNSLPYAEKLENGSSQQAPQGMVALTVVEFNQALAQAAAQSA